MRNDRLQSSLFRSLSVFGLKIRIQQLENLRMIEVKHSSGEEWLVTVKSTVTTHHRVRVTKTEAERLARGRSTEELIQESFLFLLERESNTSILTSFDLPLISSYFPEYEQEITKRLQRAD